MLQKEYIIQKLEERGCRITKQRRLILDTILEGDCSCCKEIYYKASGKDAKIGFATVYRMVNMLEEIGAISRKNMYKVTCAKEAAGGKAPAAECRCHARNTYEGIEEKVCTVELSDGTVCCLEADKWTDVIRAGMKACGYIENQEINRVAIRPEESFGDLSL